MKSICKCKNCGNTQYVAYVEVGIDGIISKTPFGPFTCTTCGELYENLPIRYYQEILIPKEEYEALAYKLCVQPRNESESMKENESFVYAASFEDGTEMEISIKGVSYNPEAKNLPYVQAHLKTKDGTLLTISEYNANDRVFGLWESEYKDSLYQVNFIPETWASK